MHHLPARRNPPHLPLPCTPLASPPPPQPQQEVGPYTFQALKVKTHVEWVGGGTGVRWLDFNSFLFEPENSNGSLDDPITTLNVPLAGGCYCRDALALVLVLVKAGHPR